MLEGPGERTCETKYNKRGYRKICTVHCDNDQAPTGPEKIRCKNYDNNQGIAYFYWHTNKKHKKINCN